MAYLGTKPQSGFISQEANQYFTGLTQNYIDLNQSINSLSSVIILVNGVVQENSTLTLTTSSRITLGATLVASDKVTCIYLAKISSTQAPSTGSVTSDMLAGSIANSKLATDPLNASNLASGTVPTARLGSGTASSSTVLYGDQTFKTAPSGSLTKVGSSTTLRSSHASASVSNCFTTDYDAYLITWVITQDRDGNEVRWRFLKSDGNTQDSSYNYHNFGYPSNSTTISQQNASSGGAVQLSGSTMGSTSSIMWSSWGSMWVYRPMGTTESKPYVYTSCWLDTSGNSIPQSGGGRQESVTAFPGIRFQTSANYFFTSDVHVYGLET